STALATRRSGCRASEPALRHPRRRRREHGGQSVREEAPIAPQLYAGNGVKHKQSTLESNCRTNPAGADGQSVGWVGCRGDAGGGGRGGSVTASRGEEPGAAGGGDEQGSSASAAGAGCDRGCRGVNFGPDVG